MPQATVSRPWNRSTRESANTSSVVRIYLGVGILEGRTHHTVPVFGTWAQSRRDTCNPTERAINSPNRAWALSPQFTRPLGLPKEEEPIVFLPGSVEPSRVHRQRRWA